MNDLLTSLADSFSEEDLVLASMEGIICGEIVSQRLKRGMNQKDFAKFMGVSQGMVSRWEKGECNFTLQSLVRIALKLNIPIQSPFGMEKPSYDVSRKVIDLPVEWHNASSPKPVFQSVNAHIEELLEM
jgi:transcriptional regulator with XRE-family HTH domain